MRKSLILLVCALVIATLLAYVGMRIANRCGDTNEHLPVSGSVTTLGGSVIAVRVADSVCERELGLSGLSELAPNEGMLFVFPNDDRHGFWMRDMQFSIDMIWIASNGVVTDSASNVSPETYPTVFLPREEARYVLEIPAHATALYDIHRGDVLKLAFPK